MMPKSLLPRAIIFDMDGVLVDSNPFHLRKWIDVFRAHGIPYDKQELPKIIMGPDNDSIFRRFLGDELTRAQLDGLGEELERNFRQEIGPQPPTFPGVRRFIEECHADGIAMGVASAAIAQNVTFVVSALGLQDYFRVLMTANEIAHPKPHPEIYLKTASKLGVDPAACLVLEDSFVGIEAAKRAGMKCVAIASTFPANDLRRETHADLILPSFETVSLHALRQLFNGASPGAGPLS